MEIEASIGTSQPHSSVRVGSVMLTIYWRDNFQESAAFTPPAHDGDVGYCQLGSSIVMPWLPGQGWVVDVDRMIGYDVVPVNTMCMPREHAQQTKTNINGTPASVDGTVGGLFRIYNACMCSLCSLSLHLEHRAWRDDVDGRGPHILFDVYAHSIHQRREHGAYFSPRSIARSEARVLNSVHSHT